MTVNTKLSSNLSFEDPLPAAKHCSTLQHAATRCNTLQQHNLLLPDRARMLNIENRSQKSLQNYRQSSTPAHCSICYSQSPHLSRKVTIDLLWICVLFFCDFVYSFFGRFYLLFFVWFCVLFCACCIQQQNTCMFCFVTDNCR